MHLATPASTSFRAHAAGGGRAMIDTIDDDKFMQEAVNTGGFASEMFPAMEAPQNYGFTSVCADADKENGKITDCAEGFISHMGGNPAFPMMAVMDDRRHRLIGLAKDAAKGASAMFGLRKWGQQLLNTEDGWFMTGNTKKKMRLQLVDNKNDDQQQSAQTDTGAPAAAAFAAGGSSGGGAGQQQQQQKKKGQKSLHKEDSNTFVDMTSGDIHSKNGNGHTSVRPNESLTYFENENKSTRCTSDHVHIRYEDFRIWIDESGCHSTMPITVVQDADTGSGGGSSARGALPVLAELSYRPNALPMADFLRRWSDEEYLRLLQRRNFDTRAGRIGLARQWDIAVAAGTVYLDQEESCVLKTGLVADHVLTQTRADEIFR